MSDVTTATAEGEQHDPDALIAWCFACQRDTRQEPYDSEDEGCARYRGGLGVHYTGSRCLDCGDLEAEPCIHD